jgi:hypothetical protein
LAPLMSDDDLRRYADDLGMDDNYRDGEPSRRNPGNPR